MADNKITEAEETTGADILGSPTPTPEEAAALAHTGIGADAGADFVADTAVQGQPEDE